MAQKMKVSEVNVYGLDNESMKINPNENNQEMNVSEINPNGLENESE